MLKYKIFSLALLFAISACVTNIEAESRPPHHTKKGFTNPNFDEPKKNFFSFLKMRFFGDDEWAKHEAYADKIPQQLLDIQKIQNPAKQAPQISWLGHSTFLIQYKGINILTDPIFSDYASPLSFIGPKRYVPHSVDYKQLPNIDIVIISHDHYDHLDKRTIQLLSNAPQYYVPLGLKKWFTQNTIDAKKVQELDWWQAINKNNITIQALPSQHWSGRTLFDRFETLWASWLIDIDGYTIWFGGDTGYSDSIFKKIGTKSNIDLALIPIGAYAPRWFMQAYHINPEEAVKIHIDIQAKKSIGMHWGTFPLTAETPTEPLEKLQQAKERTRIPVSEFITIAIGETLVIKP